MRAKVMAFDNMCRGWALGSKDFKPELLQSEGLLKDGSFVRLCLEGNDLKGANELFRNTCLERAIRAAGKPKQILPGKRSRVMT